MNSLIEEPAPDQPLTTPPTDTPSAPSPSGWPPPAPSTPPAPSAPEIPALDLPAPDQLEPEPGIQMMRLQKLLARAGVSSRRGAEDLIAAGRVCVNGQVVTQLGSKVDPDNDEISFDGRPINLRGNQVYIMLNKPAGFLTTMDDPQGRPTVAQLVPVDRYPGLFPAGRLDLDTTGLLLFMTDGELAHHLLHPRHHVSKRYRVLADGQLSEDQRQRLEAGVWLSDGPTRPAQIELLGMSKKQLTARERLRLDGDETFSEWQTEAFCTITEGRKRQVKRMFAAVGHPVLALAREAFGPLQLGNLELGQWRYLSAAEIELLRAAGSEPVI